MKFEGAGPPKSYLLCGTPRTGSTYLCDLLFSTGIAGRPESYFREADQQSWAKQFGVSLTGDRGSGYRAFVDGAVRAGTTANGVFGARIMWGSMDPIVQRLRRTSAASDLQVLVEAFGPLHFVYLRRSDVVAQAVSWARAEQTGDWHPGDASGLESRFDSGQVDALVRTICEHNDAWSAWFVEQDVRPQQLTYEELVDDPGGTVGEVLKELGLVTASGWRPQSRHVKQADEVNQEWTRRYAQRRA